jgi:hypothetical protein
MRRLRKNLFFIVLVLVGLLLAPSTAYAIWTVCMWYSDGCFVTVVQWSWGFRDIGWEMVINCWFPSDYGYWWGWGEWGGVCNGITF